MAACRNERHNYFSQDATAFTSQNLYSLPSLEICIKLLIYLFFRPLVPGDVAIISLLAMRTGCVPDVMKTS